MKNTAKFSLQGLLAGTASALALKAKNSARQLRRVGAPAGSFETSRHTGSYSLLLPARPKDA